MKITDLIFLGSTILALIGSFIFRNAPIVVIWFGLLIPIALAKVLLPESKFVKWLEKKRW